MRLGTVASATPTTTSELVPLVVDTSNTRTAVPVILTHKLTVGIGMASPSRSTKVVHAAIRPMATESPHGQVILSPVEETLSATSVVVPSA